MGDSLVYGIPKTFESTTGQVTPIIEIGRFGDNVFGVQIELLNSKLGEGERFIAGGVYYIRKKEEYRLGKVIDLSLSKSRS